MGNGPRDVLLRNVLQKANIKRGQVRELTDILPPGPPLRPVTESSEGKPAAPKERRLMIMQNTSAGVVDESAPNYGYLLVRDLETPYIALCPGLDAFPRLMGVVHARFHERPGWAGAALRY